MERSARKWLWVIGLLVALLMVYPLGRWRGGGDAPAAPQAGQRELQTSFEHYQAGRYQDAIASANAALAARPDLALAHNNLAVSYLQLGMFDDATKAAEEAIRLNPGNEMARNNLAWILRERAKADAPSGPATPLGGADGLLTQSLQHARAGRFRECIDTATQSTKLNPRLSQAFNNIGYCSWRLQLWDEAIRNTQEAIRLNPSDQLVKNNLAAIQRAKLAADAPTAK